MENGGTTDSSDVENPPDKPNEPPEIYERSKSISSTSSRGSPPLDMRQFIPGCLLLTFSFTTASMPAAYLPLVLRDELDTPESISALVISAQTLSYVASCFASPKLDEILEPNLVLVVFYFIFIISSILFSFILYFPTYLVIPIAIISRAVGGFCAGVFENIFSTVLIRKHDDKIGLLSGTTEMAINLGYLLGPLFGGAVYQWTKSYAITQIIPLAPTALFYIIFCFTVSSEFTGGSGTSSIGSDATDAPLKHAGFFNLFKRWQMVLLFFCPFFFATVCSTPTSITSPYVNDNLHGNTMTTGILFFIMSVGYMPGSVLAGILTDQPRFRKLTLWCFCLSPFLFGIGWLIAAPAKFMGLKSSIWTTGSGFFVGTLAFGFGSGPMMRILICVWRGLNPNSDVDYTAYITSMFLVTFSLGEGVGNAIGGFMYELIGFDQTLMIFGLLLILHGCINLSFTSICGNKNYMIEVSYGDEFSDETPVLSEKTPLLDDVSQSSIRDRTSNSDIN